MMSSLKTTFIFLLFGLAWIFFTDRLLLVISHDSLSDYHRIQTYKGVIFVALSATLIFIVTYLLNKKLEKVNRFLRFSNKKLSGFLDEKLDTQKKLTEAIIKAQEEERKQLGEELHDNINQVLATTKLYLDLARENPSMQADMILRSSENISLVIAELRKLSKSLSPPSLGDLGLVPSIEDLLNSILHASKLQVSFFHDEFNEDSIDNDKKLTIYRIIQEQMNNILRHANAQDVTIELKNNETHLNLTITDDGVGFDPSVPFSGIGLKNIKNRAKLYNGTMHIDAAPGEGTVLHVRIEI
jgi:signal transduction histidine kinase